MRVLNILYRLMPSGAEKMLYDAASAFKDAGVEGHILINDSQDGPFAPVLRNCGYEIVRIPWTGSRLHLIPFIRYCRQNKIDVVHIHTIRGFFSFGLAAKFAGVKVIVKTFHGIFYPKDVCRLCWHHVKRHVLRFLGCRYIAISKSVQENEKKRYHLNTELVWNWVNADEFPLAASSEGISLRSELGIPQDKFVLLTVGNCHSSPHLVVKNHQLLIRALPLLQKGVRDRVVYVHAGAEDADQTERKLAESLGVSTMIKFLGSRNDVSRLHAASNLFVMCSLREGLGNSVIEALLSGRECLLTNVSGLKDFGEVVEGVRYCDLKPESMTRAIEVIVDETVRRAGGQAQVCDGVNNYRESARKMFSVDVGVNSLLKVYRGQT